MSIQAVAWALESGVENSGAKFILVCLANYADKDGVCFPGQERLAKDAAMGVSTVRRHLSALEQLGLIRRSRRRRDDGSRTSDEYVLCTLANLQYAIETEQPLKSSNPTAQNERAYRSNRAGLPLNLEGHEPSGEPSEEPLCTKPAKRRISYPPDFEEFWSGYPTDPVQSKKDALTAWKRLSSDDRVDARRAVEPFAAHCRANPDYRPVHACRFLSQRRFEGFVAQAPPPGDERSRIVAAEAKARQEHG